MTEVTTIRAHARKAVEAQESHGTTPVNPCAPGTDGHAEWTREFYEYGTARAMRREVAVMALVSAG